MRSRTARSLLGAAYAGVATYCLLSVSAGSAGFGAYARLEALRSEMGLNLEELELRNAALSAELESLRADPDRARREARRLGYLARGETEMVLVSRRESAREREGPGRVVAYAPPGGMADATIKRLSFLAALVVLALALLGGASRRGGAPAQRESRVQSASRA